MWNLKKGTVNLFTNKISTYTEKKLMVTGRKWGE